MIENESLLMDTSNNRTISDENAVQSRQYGGFLDDEEEDW